MKIGTVDNASSFGFGAVLVRRDALQLMLDKRAAARFSLSKAHTSGGAHYYGFFKSRPQDPTDAFTEMSRFIAAGNLIAGAKFGR